MTKLNQVESHEAQAWFDNLKKQLSDTNVHITAQGLEDIAILLHQKKVGRWDALMNDAQVAELEKTPCKLNDVAELITAWFERTLDAKAFETPPTELDLSKSMYQLVSQIFKTLHVEMDKANEPTGSDNSSGTDPSAS